MSADPHVRICKAAPRSGRIEHVLDGNEFHDLSDTLDQYANDFTNLVLGDPLFATDRDFDAVAEAITASTKTKDDGETAICFMGHGTDADSNADYIKLQSVLKDKGCDNYYIGTVEATPSVDDLLESINQKGIYKKVNRVLVGEDGTHWGGLYYAD